MPPAHFARATTHPIEASLSQSNHQYRALASSYDAVTPRIEALRAEAHEFLALRKGQTVIDAGCGTGKSLAALSLAVGETGRVIAIEPCREMFEIASQRKRELSLHNVTLIEADASNIASLVAPASVDAMLFMFTHDLLQSSMAIEAAISCTRPGARFALTGGKLFSGILSPLNPWVEWRQKPYCTTFENYDAPWRKLFSHAAVSSANVHPRYLGIAYFAHALRA
jgi:ubiquinone/menaquinone biosynthesis C-methylase UbiE